MRFHTLNFYHNIGAFLTIPLLENNRNLCGFRGGDGLEIETPCSGAQLYPRYPTVSLDLILPSSRDRDRKGNKMQYVDGQVYILVDSEVVRPPFRCIEFVGEVLLVVGVERGGGG